VPRLCEFYPGIYLTTEKKHGKTSVRVRKPSVRLRKASVRVENFSGSKNLSEVDSASNRNEYREYFLGVKAAGAYG